MKRERTYYIYILSNTSKMFYIGMTNDLERRLREHRSKMRERSFTARYNLHQLIYFEEFSTPMQAIEREKQLKRWSRKKKKSLIFRVNPTWQDLAKDWNV